MSYQLILAEDVVEWLADKRSGKPTFERHFAGLTPQGLAVVESVLDAINAQVRVQDYSYSAVESRGWHTIRHTRLYASEPLGALRKIAVSALEK